MIKRLGSAVVLAAAFLAIAGSLKYAAANGVIDADTAKRAIQVLIGLGLAAYANMIPKQIGAPARSPAAESRSQAALRVGGWSMTLAGLTSAGLWAFAPLSVADTGSLAVVAAAVAVTLGYAVWCFALCRTGRLPTA